MPKSESKEADEAPMPSKDEILIGAMLERMAEADPNKHPLSPASDLSGESIRQVPTPPHFTNL